VFCACFQLSYNIQETAFKSITSL